LRRRRLRGRRLRRGRGGDRNELEAPAVDELEVPQQVRGTALGAGALEDPLEPDPGSYGEAVEAARCDRATDLQLVRFERMRVEDQEHRRVGAIEPVERCRTAHLDVCAGCLRHLQRRAEKPTFRKLVAAEDFPVCADGLVRGRVPETGRDVHLVLEGVAREPQLALSGLARGYFRERHDERERNGQHYE